VQAIGGRRLTPPQGVTALSEAIDVIRGVWDADVPGTLTVDGEFYKVHGAERGPAPAPAHHIPIWLGAHKPKMQDLVGRKADGWLPSLPVMEPDGLPKGNAIIDDAARAAGRDPRDITSASSSWPATSGMYSNASPLKRSPQYANTSPTDASRPPDSRR
jgi:alkanesulfonate monooxygenase SsuD/methylene tetrahydromethanopterin reductase-like flavin-dependent oxidoreductase (luciferase family)